MSFHADLNQRLESLRAQNLFRELRAVDSPQGPRIQLEGRSVLNFSSNDYLGLANHRAVKQAARDAIEKFGAGSGASRLICGSLAPFQELDESLAEFKQTEAALSFSTGYAAAIGAIAAIAGRDDIIILDKLVHACIVDSAKLSGAKIRVFGHNDLDHLEDKLKWAAEQNAASAARVLIVTESVFSMDGDTAPLREIVALKEKYGAYLMVDEAHATGVVGKSGRGLADHLGVADRIDVHMGTLGKALGASGGFICGSRALIDLLINSARTFLFSTAPVPAAAAAATAAVKLAQSAEGDAFRERLQSRVRQFEPGIWNRESGIQGAIIPIIVGDEKRALRAAASLLEQNIFVPAIRYPTVARGQARLRITLTAAHSSEDVACLSDALTSLEIGNVHK